MAKKYYWIKLKTDFFDLETIDWLMSQKNGCEYVVLYQKLCLLTANKGGELVSSIGEIIMPYDANKIARDTKFSFDTVVVALELFRKIGLIYEQENGILKIPYVNDIVGSETESAQRVRNHRANKTKEALQCNKNVTQDVTNVTLQCNTEIEKEIDIEKEKEIEKIPDKSGHTPPKSKKKIYGEYRKVKLTDEEYQRLCGDYSEKTISEYIRKIDEYLQMTGKKAYKDYNLAIRNWLNRDNIKKTTDKSGYEDDFSDLINIFD